MASTQEVMMSLGQPELRGDCLQFKFVPKRMQKLKNSEYSEYLFIIHNKDVGVTASNILQVHFPLFILWHLQYTQSRLMHSGMKYMYSFLTIISL